MHKRKFSSTKVVSDVFIVETICKMKLRLNKEPLYFIKWEGWDDKYNTWEPQSNILDKSLIDIFEEEEREKNKIKNDKELGTSKDMKLPEFPVESHKDVPIVDDKSVELLDKHEKLIEQPGETELVGPRICLEIPKSRMHASCADSTEKPREIDINNHEIDKSRKSLSTDNDWSFSKFSPNYLGNDECLSKTPIQGNSSSREFIPPHKTEFYKNSDSLLPKPRKLLSIREYPAKMKKHHKKSKDEKLEKIEEEKRLKHFSQLHNRHEIDEENKIDEKSESKTVRPQYQRPLTSLENKIGSWSKTCTDKDLFSEALKDEETKPVTHKLKYQSNTILTDVKVENLSVTIHEMPYADFIDTDSLRYLMIKVPIRSDWLVRYRGTSDKNVSAEIEEINYIKENITTENQVVNINSRIKILERFSETITPGLMHHNRTIWNPFSATASPLKTPVDSQVQMNSEFNICNKSHLEGIVDDCEEVDVVGGIKSDHPFVGSLQSESQDPNNQIYHISRHNNNDSKNVHLISNNNNNNNNNTCLPENSTEQNMVKPTSLLSDIYNLTTSQDMPIDLSFK